MMGQNTISCALERKNTCETLDFETNKSPETNLNGTGFDTIRS